MSEDEPETGDSAPSVPTSGDDEGDSTPSVPTSGDDEGPSVPTSGDDEGDSAPSVPSEDRESGTGETSGANASDVHDPAGLGDPPRDDATGLSGQPDADEFEGAADWSDVDDSTAVDAETHIETERQTADRQGGSEGAQTPVQGGGTGRAQGGGHAEESGTAPASGGAGAQRATGEKYCSNCGAVISQQAVVCPECGVEQADAPRQATAQSGSGGGSDPGVAALLSGIGFFIPIATGAGQLYNGDVAKGVLFTVIQLVNVGLVFLLIGIVTYPIVGIIAIYDAYKSAQR